MLEHDSDYIFPRHFLYELVVILALYPIVLRSHKGTRTSIFLIQQIFDRITGIGFVLPGGCHTSKVAGARISVLSGNEYFW